MPTNASMFDDIDWAALSSYLAGHASADAVREVERWIAAEPSRAALIEELRAIWRASGAVGPRYDVERALRQARTIRAAARSAGAEAEEAPRLRISRGVSAPTFGHARRIGDGHRVLSRGAWLGRAAAVLVLAAGAGSAIVWWRRSDTTATAARQEPVAMREVATKKGQRAEVYLSDGTRVTLGVDSRLRYSPMEGKASREVFLDGEALFAVKHDDAHHFRVHTAAAVVEDLGTEFVVRAYAPDSGMRVMVTSGRVALQPIVSGEMNSPAASTTTLERGDVGEVRAGGAVKVRRGVDPSSYMAWTGGQIAFDRVPLAQVARDLERWYDIQIEFPTQRYGAVPVTASFQNQSADEVLELLSAMLDMRYTRQGTRVTLAPEGARR